MNNENNINNSNIETAQTNTTQQTTVNNETKKEDINEITMQPKTKREYIENMPLPNMDQTHKEIETIKKQSKSPLPYILILIIISLITILNLDNIITFINSLTNENTPSIVINDTNNLVKGYVKVDDNTSSIKVNNIKYYNFKKDTNNPYITLNYISNEKIEDIKQKNIYIELYDINENLLYRVQLTNDETIFKDEINTYSIRVDTDIFNDTYYGYVTTYNEEELNKETTLICTYNESNDYSLIYKNTYYFKNDLLVSYDISKQISYINENEATKKYKSEIETEYNLLKEFNITSNYINNTLTYTIDLTKDLNGFISLYELNTTKYTVKNKDTKKKWNCE